LIERLLKAERHIEAAERRLWKETERGLWSGRQAMARVAEVWLRFQGQLDSLLPPERYLPSELLQETLVVLEGAAIGTPLAARLQEIAAAEAAILREPFSRLPNPPRDELRAGLARKYRYLDALRGLVQEVEDAIADRYVTLRVGDWVKLPGAQIGQLLDRQGLSGWFFVPALALTAIDRAIMGYSLCVLHLEPLSLGPDRSVAPHAYYWLLAVSWRWQNLERMAEGDWVSLPDFNSRLGAVLDAAAKAWLIGIAPLPRQVMWSQVYSTQNVPLLADRAPAAIAEPLIEALQRGEALSLRAIKSHGQEPQGWRDEIAGILRLTRSGLSAIEDTLQGAVDLAEGQWVEVVDDGPGQIAQRDGQRLVIDLGRLGVVATKLFETPLQRILPPAEPGAPPEDDHRRWLWYACYPQACRGRDLCPCCRLPGIAAGELGVRPCLLCGWAHDGDDYDPARRNLYLPDLTLDLGRQRFKDLGYADEMPDDPLGWAAAWLDPQVVALRRGLVTALDELALSGSEDPDRLAALDRLWADYLDEFAGRCA